MTGEWQPLFELMTDGLETIDDLIDSLWRHGSAQDYPVPFHGPHVAAPERHPTPPKLFSECLDHRFSTFDRNMDQEPVPGYCDFPDNVLVDYAAGFVAVPAGFRWRRRR